MTATRRTPSRTPGRVLTALCAAVALAGCSAENTEGQATPSTSSEAPDNRPSSADETSSSGEVLLGGDRPLDPVGDADTAAVQGGGFPAAGRPVADLVDVRAAGHETFDRFVLEFEGPAMPSYRVGYTDAPPRAAGSGDVVDIEGEAFLQVDVAPATGVDLSGNEPEETYTGPDRLRPPSARAITEAVGTGDFEARLTWVLGLDDRVPFGVTTLQDPFRLVVDLRHEAADGTEIDPVATGATHAVSAEGSGSPVVVTDVRLGAHDGFDRIVFEVAGTGEAGWDVRYSSDPRSPGSGRPVDVDGDAALAITLSNVALPPDAPPGLQPWDGPERQAIEGARALTELVTAGLFEGRHEFVAGLDQRRPFAVARFDDPQRVVVDVLLRQPRGVTLAERCDSPEGFSVGYPGDWAVNSGDVVPPCTRFGPEPFELPPGTDARIAPIVVDVEAVPYGTVVSSRGDERSRVDVTVDGRDGVRVERVTRDGLYPPGTRLTSYAVDLGTDEVGDERTLLASAVDLRGFDYRRDVEVLDAMMESIELDSTG